MPVRASLRSYYTSSSWLSIRAFILRRAKRRCEACGKPDRATILTCSNRSRMFWMPAAGGRWRSERGKVYRHLTPPWQRHGLSAPRVVRVVLAVAHVNHISGDDWPENLRAWCQWCHLMHDANRHRQTRCERKDAARPLLVEAA